MKIQLAKSMLKLLMPPKKAIFSCLRVSILFSGCLIVGCMMVGPDYKKPELDVNKDWLDGGDSHLKRGNAELGLWWKIFQDPALNSLIEVARHQNLSLQSAGIRILESRAQLGIATGLEYPQLQQAKGDLASQQISAYSPNTSPAIDRSFATTGIGFDAGWELDIWGKFRRGIEASQSNMDASIANYDDALVTVTAEVARTYVIIRTLERQVQVALENTDIESKTLKIADALYSGGLLTELDYLQAKTLLTNTQASIPPLQAAMRQAKNSLSVLLGKPPGAIDKYLIEPKPIPVAPKEAAFGIPADLLRRRPDIHRAENQLITQSALIGVAEADLYPHFSILGSISLRASDAALTAALPGVSQLADVFNAKSFQYSIGPSVSWNIFNYGRITNQVRVEDARFQALAVNYQNTVLNAAKEAENAIAAYLKSQEQLAQLKISEEASKRSSDLSLFQYREGLVDYQRVLDSQRSLLNAQEQYTRVSGDVATNLIALYKALGGGWETRLESDFVSDDIKRKMEKRTDWGDLLKPKEIEPKKNGHRSLWRFPDW